MTAHCTTHFKRHRAAAPTITLPAPGPRPASNARRGSLSRVLTALGAALTSHSSREQRPYLS